MPTPAPLRTPTPTRTSALRAQINSSPSQPSGQKSNSKGKSEGIRSPSPRITVAASRTLSETPTNTNSALKGKLETADDLAIRKAKLERIMKATQAFTRRTGNDQTPTPVQTQVQAIAAAKNTHRRDPEDPASLPHRVDNPTVVRKPSPTSARKHFLSAASPPRASVAGVLRPAGQQDPITAVPGRGRGTSPVNHFSIQHPVWDVSTHTYSLPPKHQVKKVAEVVHPEQVPTSRRVTPHRADALTNFGVVRQGVDEKPKPVRQRSPTSRYTADEIFGQPLNPTKASCPGFQGSMKTGVSRLYSVGDNDVLGTGSGVSRAGPLAVAHSLHPSGLRANSATRRPATSDPNEMTSGQKTGLRAHSAGDGSLGGRRRFTSKSSGDLFSDNEPLAPPKRTSSPTMRTSDDNPLGKGPKVAPQPQRRLQRPETQGTKNLLSWC
jgi:hypothetical protein